MKLDKLESILLILTLLSARDHCHNIKFFAMYKSLQYFPPSPSQWCNKDTETSVTFISGYLSINLVRWNKIEKFDKN